MSFSPTALKVDIDINQVVTIHYFEHAKDYVFHGEKHDFWEFLYVDKGKVEVMADTQGYELKQGEIIFHKPNEFHNIWANGQIAPNLVVVSFICRSPAMQFFHNKILKIGTFEKNLLSNIIKEARETFTSELGDPDMKGLDRQEESSFGSEQLIKLYLEQLMISLIRKNTAIHRERRISSIAKERSNEDISNKIIHYLQDNIRKSLKFSDVLRYSNLGSTHLKVVFKEKTGTSVMEYYRKLKIEYAKTLIREEQLNITQIGQYLGFTSIHYFSKQFKAMTGMSPMEYSRSVKAKVTKL